MRNGEYTFVCKFPSSSGNKFYTIKMATDGSLSCDCPSWIFKQKSAVSGKRICKHIDSLLKAGFTTSEHGKFITVERMTAPLYQPFFCTKHPTGCEQCALRFRCWVEESPVFTENELKGAGL